MQTGVPTAVCAVFDLATYIAFVSQTLQFFCPVISRPSCCFTQSSRMYVTSMHLWYQKKIAIWSTALLFPSSHLLFSAPLGVLYACTLMANLNARKDFKFDNTAVITVESQPVYRASLLSTAKIPVDVIELQQPESQNRSSSGSNIMQVSSPLYILSLTRGADTLNTWFPSQVRAQVRAELQV